MHWRAFPISLAAVLPLLLLGSVHAEPLALEEVARIGAADAESDLAFGQIDYAAALDDGSVVVVDRQIPRIRRFSKMGSFANYVGHEGPGPGEYFRPRGMVALPDHRVAVLSDPRLLTIFDAEADSLVNSFSVPSGLFAPDLLMADDDGNIYVKNRDEDRSTESDWAFEWIRVDGAGAVLGRLKVPMERPSFEPMVIIFPEGGRFNFVESTLSALTRDGHFVVGRNDSYSFEVRSAVDPVAVTRPWKPCNLTPGEREQWKGYAERLERRNGNSLDVPASKPAFRDLRVDRWGRIWVHRYVEAQEVTSIDEDGDPYTQWREPNVFDVFAKDGSFVGTVELPIGVRAVARSRDSIWGVQETDEGENLVRWRIEGLESVD